MSSDLECPVDYVTINENQARLTALLVLILATVWLFAGYIVIPAFLTIDFALRAFNLGKYSVLGISSTFLIKKLSIRNKPVDRAPKRFAALVGFVFTLAISILLLAGIPLPAKILGVVLVIFAALESFAGFCAGCYVYSFLIKFKRKEPSKLR